EVFGKVYFIANFGVFSIPPSIRSKRQHFTFKKFLYIFFQWNIFSVFQFWVGLWFAFAVGYNFAFLVSQRSVHRYLSITEVFIVKYFAVFVFFKIQKHFFNHCYMLRQKLHSFFA